jgi:hypothetical protein
MKHVVYIFTGIIMRIILLAFILSLGLVLPSLAAEEIVQGIAKPWQSYYQGAASPVMEQVLCLCAILS